MNSFLITMYLFLKYANFFWVPSHYIKFSPVKQTRIQRHVAEPQNSGAASHYLVWMLRKCMLIVLYVKGEISGHYMTTGGY